MLEANRISNKQLDLTQRAFVYAGSPVFESMNSNTGEFIIAAPVGNSGNTPTQKLIYCLGCKVGVGGVVDLMTTFFADRVHSVLGPRVVISPRACSVTKDNDGTLHAENTNDSGKNLMAMARITYREVIEPDTPRETMACFVLANFDVNPNAHVVAHPCDYYNCVDDECTEQRKALGMIGLPLGEWPEQAAPTPHDTSPGRS